MRQRGRNAISWNRLLGAAALAALLACNLGGSASAQKKIVIRSVPIGNLKIVDPIWTTAYITRNHAYMVWDTLFSLDADNKPQPQMVDTWSVSDDKLTYMFTLRDGLKWHDGGAVTAADCVQSLKRWGAKDGMGQALMSYTASLAPVEPSARMSFPHAMPARAAALSNRDPRNGRSTAGPFRGLSCACACHG